MLTTLRNALDADETGVLTLLKNSENDLTRIREHFPAAGEYAARLHSVLEELKDIDNAVAADSERLDADPERLAKLAARLDALYALQQKHRVASEAELIAARDRYAAQLAAIVHGDEEIAAAQLKCLDRLYDYNMTRPTEAEKRTKMLEEMFGTGCTRHAQKPPRPSKNRYWRRSCSWACPKPYSE